MLYLLKGIMMNKLTCSAWVLALCLNAPWAMAAEGTKELDSNMTTEEMPQQMEPTRTADDKPVVKHTTQKKHKHGSTMHKKTMDKSTMDKSMDMPMDKSMDNSTDGSNSNSMNSKPIGTTTDNPEVNPKDATNGKQY